MRGHFLAELLVALGAVVPAILLLFGLFPVAHRMEQSSWERWTATEVAQEKLEWLRQADYGAIPAASSETVVRDGRKFVLQQETRELIPGRLKQVTVSVRGPAQGVTLELRRACP